MINVADIKKGLPGISPITAAHLYESFMVCMHRSNHPAKTVLEMEEPYQPTEIEWYDYYDETIERTYSDMQYTTEHGAVCLSAMLTIKLTPYTVIERSRKGTGFDYWLGNKESELFQKKARLEVSGIFAGDDATVNNRYRQKAKQTEQSDATTLPAYISVVEFSRPKAIFRQKDREA